ncbi:hypothetical protein [Jeotgalibaca caeni]|uniref:hypothetical protein n=1 Tax=Jeotgalibaca caeni TaxID=3028623 RepID=UPI00237DE8C0|nr:hypothetical protein [Jeotgalibaca caeni]MDE1548597.1 hypothetical protein [Jeotgalibaca caeni]
MERSTRLFPELARAVKYKISVEGDLFLRQCASGTNLFHLPASYHYPTGNIPGYFISLNWNDHFIVLEKERKENNEYYIIDRHVESVKGPYHWVEYEAVKNELGVHIPLIPVAELDWIINI